uniref:Uncharacterized protein n=1 Tax=Tanacetum cinerariifolium TaxID=118510 RepID=A0A6L2NYN8_TANCI|nr:hypothetical protein [Tanacetum cinerariifolium]
MEDDDQEGPSTGSDRGSKRRREGGEHASASTPSEPATGSTGRSTTGTQSRQLSASESAFTEEPVQTTYQMEEPSHPVFETGSEDQPIVQTSQHPEWFSQPKRPPTSDRDWNKTLPAAQGNAQSWISALVKQIDARSSFNELLDTPIDFSNFIMNRLGVDTLTPELLAVQTLDIGISILLAVGTPSTGSRNLYCQWELSSRSGNALCILFLTLGSPFLWQWEHPLLVVGNYTASGNSLLAVGMPCAFYSQQAGLSAFELPLGLPPSFADPCTDVQCRGS